MMCRLEDCDRRHFGRGLCQKHYYRWVKYGTTDLPKKLAGRDLLYASIEIVGDCWLWVGQVTEGGYGRLGEQFVHRISYETFVGPIPDGLHIDHVKKRGCRFRLCINPAHLEPVTVTENNHRMRKERCLRGHSMVEGDPNVYVTTEGERQCRACNAQRARDNYRSVPRVPVG